ncbi:adenosine receptor A2b-like [Clytia hemisphaerica]|uniref:adenosine receptor A2b-like n=1 Tax=Clytia hemisphaerica TaxID=252671 RepID=UPI0034D7A901
MTFAAKILYITALLPLLICNQGNSVKTNHDNISSNVSTTSNTTNTFSTASPYVNDVTTDIRGTFSTSINKMIATEKFNSSANDTVIPYCEQRRLNLRTVLYIILLVFVFIVGIVSNVLAVCVILTSRSLRQYPTNLLIASLNLCDIGVILCNIPLRADQLIYDNGSFCFDIHACRFFHVTDLLFHVSSISHLFVIAIERCVAVRAPFFHRYSVTSKTILKVACMTWTYSALWTGVGMFNWENPSLETIMIISLDKRYCLLNNKLYHIVILIVIYLIPLILMAVMYSLILRSVTRHQKRMAQNATPTQTPMMQQRNRHNQHVRKHEENLSKTVTILYGTFVICWLPTTITVLTHQLCPECWVSFKAEYHTLNDILTTTFIIVLPNIHSCLNPFIYIIFHEKFKTAFQDMIGRRLRNGQVSESVSEERKPLDFGATYRVKLTKTSEDL